MGRYKYDAEVVHVKGKTPVWNFDRSPKTFYLEDFWWDDECKGWKWRNPGTQGEYVAPWLRDELASAYAASDSFNFRRDPREVASESNLNKIDTLVEVEDQVNHPKHYTSDPSGIECIEITRHRNFTIGSAIKYLWRAGLKGGDLDKEIQDLEKAIWYIQDRINQLKKEAENG